MQIEGRLVHDSSTVQVQIEGPRIARVESGAAAPDHWLAPGLLDVQVNGYGGHDVLAPDVTADTIRQLVHALWVKGVTAICPTVTTQSEERICRSLAAIAAACAADPLIAHAIPCIHVEGPFIAAEDGPRGAHPLEYVRPPSIAEYRRWQDAAGGRVGIVTMAPEYSGSPDFIAQVTASGSIVAIGHTAASGEQLDAAVKAGARLSTHLGNGSHAMLPRHTNYVWDQLADDRLWAGLIFDGHHLPPPLMRVFLRAKGSGRCVLVSDAVAIAGLPPGVYDSPIGGTVELLPNGRLNLAGTPYLAGSASTLLDGIANALRFTDATLADAIAMTATNPARLLGLDRREGRGRVAAGGAADLTVFSIDPVAGTVRVEMTIVAGSVVYQRAA
jgi:N-acetylglucosamine-6-phosphate deacetylase